MPSDPLVNDPSSSLVPHAVNVPVAFDSSGQLLLGVLHTPAGPGPHPIVVLLHGFPGNERNFDLAQVLSRAGYAAVVFHYRGSWGIGGTWTWSHVLEDAKRVVDAVRAADFVARHRLAPDRVAVVGHSLGGFAALRIAAADQDIAAVGSIAGFDLGAAAGAAALDPEARAGYVAAFADSLLPLTGTSGEALVAEMEAAGDDWALARLAEPLADRPVLLVAGSRDDVAPTALHHEPLVAAYLMRSVTALEHAIFPTDHAFSDHRVALARTVLAFLNRHLRAAR
ncbi:alpha/beta hydrolase family protein [Embleya sp. NPDC050493]|uniref:alpha/beta hydrolase family protein n=1 Tax=Embleya sp. NPDC050493 TaxID=3363989 RepID=UPI0037904F7C